MNICVKLITCNIYFFTTPLLIRISELCSWTRMWCHTARRWRARNTRRVTRAWLWGPARGLKDWAKGRGQDWRPTSISSTCYRSDNHYLTFSMHFSHFSILCDFIPTLFSRHYYKLFLTPCWWWIHYGLGLGAGGDMVSIEVYWANWMCLVDQPILPSQGHLPDASEQVHQVHGLCDLHLVQLCLQPAWGIPAPQTLQDGSAWGDQVRSLGCHIIIIIKN